jgi:hypothetical protein
LACSGVIFALSGHTSAETQLYLPSEYSAAKLKANDPQGYYSEAYKDKRKGELTRKPSGLEASSLEQHVLQGHNRKFPENTLDGFVYTTSNVEMAKRWAVNLAEDLGESRGKEIMKSSHFAEELEDKLREMIGTMVGQKLGEILQAETGVKMEADKDGKAFGVKEGIELAEGLARVMRASLAGNDAIRPGRDLGKKLGIKLGGEIGGWVFPLDQRKTREANVIFEVAKIKLSDPKAKLPSKRMEEFAVKSFVPWSAMKDKEPIEVKASEVKRK